MAQNLRKHHVPICAKKKVFSTFKTKEVTVEKQIMWPFLVIFFGNSSMCNRVRSTVFTVKRANKIFEFVNALCLCWTQRCDSNDSARPK